MKVSIIKFAFILCVVLLWNNNKAVAQLTFFEDTFIPHNLNYDGTVAVGINTQEHLIWRKSQGIEAIGGKTSMPYAGRASLSEDGMVVGGSISFGISSEMAIYNVSEGTWQTSDIVSDTTSQEIYASGYRISGNGNLLVGVKGYNFTQTKAITFNADGNITQLPYPESDAGARANVVSSDGSVIGGCIISNGYQREGAYWVDNIFYPLLDTDNNPTGEVMAVSADGSTLFGYGYGANNDIYKYDIPSHTFEVLCAANVNGGVPPILIDMSDDGKVGLVVYYNYTNLALSQVYIYIDKAVGEDVYMNINDYLDSIGIDRQGVNVNHVVAVSGNGQVLAGIDGSDIYTSPSFIIEMGDILSVSENTNAAKTWSVCPNPTKDMINLNLPNDYEQFSINDIHGKCIKTYAKGMCPSVLNVSDLPNGMYLLHVKTKQTDLFDKLVKY